MITEFEARKLEINMREVIQLIESAGGKLSGIFFQRRYVYDFSPPQKGKWIRLRSNGVDASITVKERKNNEIGGMEELEIGVSDFEGANKLLNKLGYSPQSFQENFRIEYTLNNAVLDIDKWPMIPALLEIEGDSEDSVLNALKPINISKGDVITLGIKELYREVYNINLDDIQHLAFTDDEKVEMKALIAEKYPDKVNVMG